MKQAIFFLSAAAVLFAQGGALPRHPREIQFKPRDYMPPKRADFQHKLANGGTAFLVPDKQFPLINVSVIVRTGEYLNPRDKVGVAELTGSQIRSGGTTSRPPLQFDEEAAFLAAQIGSNMSPLDAGANVNCLKKDIDACLALFVDMLRNPGFDEGRLKLAKSQLLQGMERRNDDPASIEQREFARLMRGPNHFSTQQITKASLESITRQDLIAFHQRYYYPANFVFAVSGDFEPADMKARLEKAFGDWPNRTETIPPVPKPDITPKPGVYLVQKDGVNQGRVRIGHLGVTFDNPDHLALNVMNGILGGNAFTSRITNRVRSDEGLAYSAGSVFQHGNYYPGVFAAVFQSKSGTVAQAIQIIREEIDRVRTAPVSAEELETEKNSAIETLPRRFATAQQRAGQFAMDFYLKMPEDYWQRYRERIRAMTAADVQRVAKQYLQPDKLVIFAVGDLGAIRKGNPDKPQYSIEKFGPVTQLPLPDPLTMVYPAGGAQ